MITKLHQGQSAILLILFAVLSFTACNSSRNYMEKYRPQYHFTPAINWMNDPNGLVFHKGEYHLFYQYNPFGIRWGHMSWGHAVSKDLLHWEHLPVALPEEDGVMIFSGSAVVDHNNTSGLGSEENPPLIAIYTGHTETNQSQHIAHSLDDGRTWTKYPGNPVIDLGMKDFRDPKVFWHEPSQKWVMVVSLSQDRQVAFFNSPNLIDWEETGRFGPAGATEGIWECPDLFELPIENEPGQTRWVLYLNIGSAAVAGGSGAQYFVGSFDGETFNAEHEDVRWADYGKDFYAAVSYSDIPENDGRRIIHGWMNNWQYAQEIPTDPWRSSQSLPRVVTLRNTSSGMRLIQYPIEEAKTLRGKQITFKNLPLQAANNHQLSGKQIEMYVELEGLKEGFVEIQLLKSKNHHTALRYDIDKQEISLDRTNSGNTSFHEEFPTITSAPLPLAGQSLTLHLFIDHASIEVFGDDGAVVLTNQVFPTEPQSGIHFISEDPDIRIRRLDVWSMKSVW